MHAMNFSRKPVSQTSTVVNHYRVDGYRHRKRNLNDWGSSDPHHRGNHFNACTVLIVWCLLAAAGSAVAETTAPSPTQITRFVECGSYITVESYVTYIIGYHNSSAPGASHCPSINGTLLRIYEDPSFATFPNALPPINGVEVIVRNTNEVVRVDAYAVATNGSLCDPRLSLQMANLSIVVENVSWFSRDARTGLDGWTMLSMAFCIVAVTNVTISLTNVTIGHSGSVAEAARVNALGFSATLPHTGPQTVSLFNMGLSGDADRRLSGFTLGLQNVSIQAPMASALFAIIGPDVSDVSLTIVDASVVVVSDLGTGSRAGVMLVETNRTRVSGVAVVVRRSFLFWNESCNALFPATCSSILPTFASPGTGAQSRALISVFTQANLTTFSNIMCAAYDSRFVNVVHGVGVGSNNAILNVFRYTYPGNFPAFANTYNVTIVIANATVTMSGKNIVFVYLGHGTGSFERVQVRIANVTMYGTSRLPSMFGSNSVLVNVVTLDSSSVTVYVDMRNIALCTDMNSGVSSIAALETSNIMEISSSMIAIGGHTKDGTFVLSNVSHVSVMDKGFLGGLVLSSTNGAGITLPVLSVFATASIICNSLNIRYANVTMDVHAANLTASFNTTIVRSPADAATTSILGAVCVPMALLLVTVNCTTCMIRVSDSTMHVSTLEILNPQQHPVLTGRLVSGLAMGFDTKTMFSILNNISSSGATVFLRALIDIVGSTRIVYELSQSRLTNVNISVANPLQSTTRNGPLDVPMLAGVLVLPPSSLQCNFTVGRANVFVTDPVAPLSGVVFSGAAAYRSPVIVTALVAYADATTMTTVTATFDDIRLTSPYASLMTAFGVVVDQPVLFLGGSVVAATNVMVDSRDPGGVRQRAASNVFADVRSVALARAPSAFFVNSSHIELQQGSRVVIANSTFLGLASLTPSVGSVVNAGGGLSDADTAARAMQVHLGAALVLGCNVWEGVAMPSGRHLLDDTGGGGPSLAEIMPFVASPARRLLGVAGSDAMRYGAYECGGPLESLSLTPTRILPVHVPPPQPSATAADVPAASGAVMAASGVAAVVAVSASLGGLVGFPLAQSISAVGRLQARCESASDGSSSSSSGDGSVGPNPFTGIDENPLQLPSLSIGDASVTGSAAGAVVGNVLLVLLVAGALGAGRSAAAHVHGRRRAARSTAMMQTTFSGAVPRKVVKHKQRGAHNSDSSISSVEYCASVGWRINAAFRDVSLPPGSALLPYMILHQPTVSAGVALVAADGVGAGGVVIGVAGAAAVVAFTVFVVYVVLLAGGVRRHFVCVPSLSAKIAVKGRHRRLSSSLQLLKAVVAWCTVPTELWGRRLSSTSTSAAATEVMQRYAAVFTTYRGSRLWYVVADLGTGIACGAIAGAAKVNDDPCGAVVWSGWLLAAVSAALGGAVVVLQPYACRQDALLAVVSAILTVASSIGGATNTIGSDANFALSLACIALQLLPLLLALCRVPLARCLGISYGVAAHCALSTTSNRLKGNRSAEENEGERWAPNVVEVSLLSLGDRRIGAAGEALRALVAAICEERPQF